MRPPAIRRGSDVRAGVDACVPTEPIRHHVPLAPACLWHTNSGYDGHDIALGGSSAPACVSARVCVCWGRLLGHCLFVTSTSIHARKHTPNKSLIHASKLRSALTVRSSFQRSRNINQIAVERASAFQINGAAGGVRHSPTIHYFKVPS